MALQGVIAQVNARVPDLVIRLGGFNLQNCASQRHAAIKLTWEAADIMCCSAWCVQPATEAPEETAPDVAATLPAGWPAGEGADQQ
jgi:hypothetical protein